MRPESFSPRRNRRGTDAVGRLSGAERPEVVPRRERIVLVVPDNGDTDSQLRQRIRAALDSLRRD